MAVTLIQTEELHGNKLKSNSPCFRARQTSIMVVGKMFIKVLIIKIL